MNNAAKEPVCKTCEDEKHIGILKERAAPDDGNKYFWHVKPCPTCNDTEKEKAE